MNGQEPLIQKFMRNLHLEWSRRLNGLSLCLFGLLAYLETQSLEAEGQTLIGSRRMEYWGRLALNGEENRGNDTSYLGKRNFAQSSTPYFVCSETSVLSKAGVGQRSLIKNWKICTN